MFSFFKWFFTAVLAASILLTGFVLINQSPTYEAPYPQITASEDPVVIERGKYLFYGPSHCAGCHVPKDKTYLIEAGETVPPSGGEDFHLPIGTIYAPNITPDLKTGIGHLTDGELARTLRYGIKSDGQPLIDFMPYYDMSDDDLTAIVSFLRSVEPVSNKRPSHDFNFLGKALYAFGVIEPKGDGDVPEAPELAPTAEYGKYVADILANCKGCHTKRDMMTGEYIAPDYSGGLVVGIANNDEQAESQHIYTPNLTPHPESGRIANWTEEIFIARFRMGRVIEGSIMPWGQFSRMSDMELKALYRYFMSLNPVENNPPIPAGIQEGPPPG